jgi:hypothetical protein
MGSVRTQPSTSTRVAYCDDIPGGDEDLGFIRHRLDALAYARAVGGLGPKDEIEYGRLCQREHAMLDAIRALSAHQVVR